MRLMLVQRFVADKRVDEGQARQILQGFLDELAETLDQLGKLIQNSDFTSLVQRSAALRSQAAELCVSEVADAAAALEMAAEAGSAVACAVHYDALRRNTADVSQDD